MMLLEEMASIFLTPYLLMFVVPKRVDDILKFIKDFTVDVEGVGHVCRFSLFDFRNHGNKRYGSPFDSTRDQRSSQGKMEKSFLSFQITYPSWDPNDDGKQFLSSLKMFRDQKLRGQGTAISQTTSGMAHQNPKFRGFGAGKRNAMLSREMPFNNMGNFHQLDSMWLIDAEQKNFPYILEWYYTSHNHDRDRDADSSRERPPRSYDHDEENPPAQWMPPHLTNNTPKYNDENWDDSLFEDRTQSHLEASTSVPLFQESLLRQQHHESNDMQHPVRSHWWARTRPQGPGHETSFLEPPNFFHEASTSVPLFQESVQQQQHHESNDMQHPGRSHWWARTQPQGLGQETSFLEPPNFFQEASNDDLDNYSDERSDEEHQLELGNSRGLSRTFVMDDLDGGNFSLPFVDIYKDPSEDSGPG